MKWLLLYAILLKDQEPATRLLISYEVRCITSLRLSLLRRHKSREHEHKLRKSSYSASAPSLKTAVQAKSSKSVQPREQVKQGAAMQL